MSLRVFNDIFLRLIKTIVAPLILATLVKGIAGHGNLKSVRRMGIKSLVYWSREAGGLPEGFKQTVFAEIEEELVVVAELLEHGVFEQADGRVIELLDGCGRTR